MASPRREVEIIKSGGDERNYRGLVLENGMKIVLVSDPTTDKAAAALDVNIGSMSDPVPGLAHFCEHMLFLGTKKYQDENEYNRYLSQVKSFWNMHVNLHIIQLISIVLFLSPPPLPQKEQGEFFEVMTRHMN